jgi:uncharacterized protein
VTNVDTRRWSERYPSLPYIAPFILFLAFLTISSQHYLSAFWEAPLWVLVMAVVCYICWPAELSIRPCHLVASVAVGLAVFVLWIAPDLLIHGYRENPLLSNSVMGHLHSSIRPEELQSPWVLAWRSARAILIVPIVEELFWRAWLLRWLIHNDFLKVPLGAFTVVSFALTAGLFALEHGPYWDVGLAAGIIYNYWMIRTKSVADCVIMHAVTNASLSFFVIADAQWQYWQ